MCVQAFGPKLSVEAFDERVVGRLAGPGEVECDAFLVCPQIKVTGDELRTLINPNGFGIAMLAAHALRGSM